METEKSVENLSKISLLPIIEPKKSTEGANRSCRKKEVGKCNEIITNAFVGFRY